MVKVTFRTEQEAQTAAARLANWGKAARADGCVVTTNASASDRRAVGAPTAARRALTGYAGE